MGSEQDSKMTWTAFLMGQPPSKPIQVRNLYEIDSYKVNRILKAPDLLLHCTSDICAGPRIFVGQVQHGEFLKLNEWSIALLSYYCRNCTGESKSFAVVLRPNDDGNGEAAKMGEWPKFGQKVPDRLLSLLGDDRELFLQGRRSENQGMGLGAFAYYRRVVENQKNRLLEQIIQVAHRLGASREIVESLEKAKANWQFARSLDEFDVKLPEQLMINGQNPLRLLHSVMSGGIHDESDEHCLKIAASIRIVLASLADRIGGVLADQEDLNRAIKELLEAGRRESVKT